MKNLYFIIVTFLLITIVNAQIVNIPNANFKAKLLLANTSYNIAQNSSNANIKIDINNDGEIQVIEASMVYGLNIGYADINNLTGIESFTNLQKLNCQNNPLTSLNLNGLINLQQLKCQFNLLTNLDVSGLSNLQLLHCFSNQLTNLTVSGLTNLNSLDCNNNQLTNLNLSGLTNLNSLICSNNQFANINLGGLTNLNSLICSNNQFANIDLSELTNLNSLNCNSNQLTNIDLSGLTNLQILSCSNNQLSNIDLSGINGLQSLACSYNQLTTIDVSGITSLQSLYCFNNQLTTLFIKNNNSQWSNLVFQNNPNLEYICSDGEDVPYVEQLITEYGYTNCHVNSYCSFTPGGTYYTIQGTNRIDTNNDGCTAQDIVYPNLKFGFYDGNNIRGFISNDSGNYNITVPAEGYTFTPLLENPSYFNISPSSGNVSFPATTSPFTQNFCMTPNGVHHDLEIVIIPIGVAQPGFDATYKIIYKNIGNQAENASINFNFNDAVLDFVTSSNTPSSQNLNILSWNVGTLIPLQKGEILVTFNVNSPMETPAVNVGDLLNYSSNINGLNTDVNQENNYFLYSQAVVNSYNTNDKECLEGTNISESNIGNYVHYKISFENTGTYPVQNVVIRDIIDVAKFDISTLQITDASHSCVAKTNPILVEFIFENINLPFDDATNDGYVVFKIKTKPTLVAWNTISNLATIYFDYNFPIVTNTATSIFTSLVINEVENKSVVVYPNPTTGLINIVSNDFIKTVELYDIQGRLLMAKINDSQTTTLDISEQSLGTYFVKVITVNGVKIEKVLKD